MVIGRVRVSILAGFALANGSCGGPTADVQEPEMGAVVVTQWNDSTDLFLEYPHPVAGPTPRTAPWTKEYIYHRGPGRGRLAGIYLVLFSTMHPNFRWYSACHHEV